MAYAAVLVLCLILAAPAAAAPVRSIADAPTRAVETDRGQIGYRSFGRGERPPLVLIMGLSGTMDVWPPSFVDRLAARRLVITFDNRGVGRTEPGAGPLTISAMADDTAALIRALRLRRADVLGWSMGGMVAQSLARRHPQVMRRLVLCASAPGDGRATLPQADLLPSSVEVVSSACSSRRAGQASRGASSATSRAIPTSGAVPRGRSPSSSSVRRRPGSPEATPPARARSGCGARC